MLPSVATRGSLNTTTFLFGFVQVQWESKEKKNQFQPYPAEINTKLEKAFHQGETHLNWEEEEANGNIVKWRVDLGAKDKTETNGVITKEVHRRIIAEKGQLFSQR